MLSVEKEGSVSVICVHGEIDNSNVERLASVLAIARQDAEHRIVLSLTECRYCDSSGLHAVIKAHRMSPERFAIVIPPENAMLHRLLRMTGLNKVFTVYPSVDAALSPVAAR
jgi:anti-anti-sigma factor